MIAWLVQIQNLIGKAADAASMASTLFAGQQQIHDDITAAIGSAPTEKSLQDILHKDGSFTFDNTTDSLEAIRDKINTLPTTLSYTPLAYTGTCDAGMSASATTVVCAGLAGFGDDYFNGKFWMVVVKNANSVGNAPERQARPVTDYVSASGTFTVTAFGANVEANDQVMVIHESIPLPLKSSQEYTSGSGNWTCPVGVNFVDVLIVAGGGNGGGNDGGGGGEVVTVSRYPVTPGSNYAYVVGAAGASSSFAGITASPGANGSESTGGAGGGAFTDAAGGDGGANGLSSGGNRIARHGGGGGGAAANNGGNSYFAAGGTAGGGLGGGGGSWKAGANASNNAAANSGGGGSGGGFTGGSGYILITWGY